MARHPETEKWIGKATEHKGAFRKAMHKKPGEKITQADIDKGKKAGGKTAKQAQLAETLSHLRKKK